MQVPGDHLETRILLFGGFFYSFDPPFVRCVLMIHRSPWQWQDQTSGSSHRLELRQIAQLFCRKSLSLLMTPALTSNDRRPNLPFAKFLKMVVNSPRVYPRHRGHHRLDSHPICKILPRAEPGSPDHCHNEPPGVRRRHGTRPAVQVRCQV